MHAAIVLVLFQIPVLVHMRRLPIPAVGLVAVVRILQITHRARRVVVRIDDILSQQPVVAIDHRAKDIGERFVEGTRLEEVLQVYRFLDDTMGHFVRGHIQRCCQGANGLAAVAVGHEHAVPIGVFHGLTTIGHMDYRDHGTAIAGNAQATVDRGKVVVYQGHIGVGRNRRRIGKRIVDTDDVR